MMGGLEDRGCHRGRRLCRSQRGWVAGRPVNGYQQSFVPDMNALLQSRLDILSEL